MKDRKRYRLCLAASFALMIGGSAATLLGDTLVLRDGREITGDIERIDGGYRVKTATGVVQVSRSDVAEWKRSTAPAVPAPSITPPTTPAVTPVPVTGTANPSKPGPTTNPADRNRRTVEVLVSQGVDALALGDIKASRDLLVDAIQLDPRHRVALESVGYCYLKLDDIPRATRSMEAAIAGSTTQSKALTMNLAYALLRSRNPMRGAKMIKDYLAANSTTLDEEALNAYAICLGQSTEESRLNRFWTECVTFYDQYNAKLEATKPGQKRWGIQWVSQAEWSTTESKNKVIQSQMENKWRDVQAATADFNRAKKAYADAYNANRFRKNNGPTAASLEPQVRSTKARAESLQAEYDTLSAKLIRPTLPKLFEPVQLDPSTLVVASAGTGTGISSGVGSSSPGLKPEPAPQTPPTAVQPQPQPQPTPQPSPQPVDPPVAVAPPPPPEPTPTPPAPEVRRRAIFTSACGFAIAPDLIVTSAASVEGTTRITVQGADSNPADAEVVRTDPASGLALLRLKGRKMAYLPVADTFTGGTIQCVSFPTVSIFDLMCEVIGGSSVPPKDDWTIRLNKHPRVAGAPIIAGGKVVGVELASRDNDSTTLPSANLAKLKTFVGALPPSPMLADPTAAVVMVSGVREK